MSQTKLTEKEELLLEHAKAGVIKYNTSRHALGYIDTLYSFLITTDGHLYDGAAFEPNIAQATVCGERHALANMTMHMGNNVKIESIIVLDCVPKIQPKSTPPCGTCRHLIWQFGKPDTTVLMMQYIQERGADGKLSWSFPPNTLTKLTISDLYPYPYEPNPDLWK